MSFNQLTVNDEYTRQWRNSRILTSRLAKKLFKYYSWPFRLYLKTYQISKKFNYILLRF